MEIRDSLEKQRNELLDNIADSDKADLLKRIETLKLEVKNISSDWTIMILMAIITRITKTHCLTKMM